MVALSVLMTTIKTMQCAVNAIYNINLILSLRVVIIKVVHFKRMKNI